MRYPRRSWLVAAHAERLAALTRARRLQPAAQVPDLTPQPDTTVEFPAIQECVDGSESGLVGVGVGDPEPLRPAAAVVGVTAVANLTRLVDDLTAAPLPLGDVALSPQEPQSLPPWACTPQRVAGAATGPTSSRWP